MMTTSAALDARTSLNFKNAMTYGTSMTTFRLSGSFSNANAGSNAGTNSFTQHAQSRPAVHTWRFVNDI